MRLFRFSSRPQADADAKEDGTIPPAGRVCINLERPWKTEFREECSEEDIYYCFRLILGRNPGKVEWPGHRALAGNNLSNVVSMYLSSREFRTRELGVLSDTEHVLVDLEGYQMYVSPSDIEVGTHIYGDKIYEPHITRHMKHALAPGMFFLDVGANIGYFTLLAAHLVGCQGKVFAVEPYQYNVKLLYLSAQRNGFENVEILPFAVADKRTLLAYDNVASNGVISEISLDIDSVLQSSLIYGVRLDDVLRDIERLDVIKIDVEGAEYMALDGGRNLLRKHRPTVFSEFAPPALEVVSKVSAEAYLRLLLVDESYSIAVCGLSGDLVDCGRDMNKVIWCFEDSGVDHIDIVAYPTDNCLWRETSES
jgi:FkbM family methyltransferase